MKKMLFSAIALVAFTVTSFAGESITKKSETSVDVGILNSIKQDVLKSGTSCVIALVVFTATSMPEETPFEKIIKLEEVNKVESLHLSILKDPCEVLGDRVFRETVWDTGSQIYAHYNAMRAEDTCRALVAFFD